MSGWVAGGIVVGAVIGAVSSSESSRKQAHAAEDAASKVAETADASTSLQERMYEENVARQEPWRKAGVNALSQLSAGTAPGGEFIRPFGMEDFQADPGYQFRLEEGTKALDRSAASRGLLLSGSQLKGLERYGQGVASQEYGNAYNRYQQQQGTSYNRLAGMAGVGQTAVGQLQQSGQQYGTAAGDIAMQSGANQANAMLAAGQARASAYQGYGNVAGQAAGQFANYYGQQNQYPAFNSPESSYYGNYGPTQGDN